MQDSVINLDSVGICSVAVVFRGGCYTDRKGLNKLRASSVLYHHLDVTKVVSEKSRLAKLTSIMDNRTCPH